MELDRSKMWSNRFLFAQYCLPILVSLCFSSAINGHDLYFKHFTVSDGLAENSVNCIVEDQFGFMWFGTSAGLNRFDGERWITFFADESNANSLCGNIVLHLETDTDGTLWIATEDGGLCRYFPERQVFKKYELPEIESKQNPEFLSLHASLKGDVYVSIDLEGIHKLDRESGTFLRDSKFVDEENQRFFSILSTENAIYAGQLATGLKVVQTANNTALQFNFFDGKNFPYPGHTPVGLHRDEYGIIWSGSWDNGLYRFDEKNQLWEIVDTLGHKPLSHNDDEIVSISSLDNRLFIGTKRSGLYIFDIENKKFTNVTHQFIVKSSLSSNHIRQVYRDSRNLIWIATDAGLNLYSDRLNKFQTHYQFGDPTLTDFGDLVTGIAPADDYIFLTTIGNVWFTKASDIKLKPVDRSFWEPTESFHSIFRSRNGNVFLGTTKTAYWFAPENMEPQTLNRISYNVHRTFDFFDIFSSRINSIREANSFGSDAIAFSIYGHGMAIINESTKSGVFSAIISEKGEHTGTVNGFFNTKQNDLWILTKSIGIVNLDIESHKKSRIFEEAMQNRVNCRGLCLLNDTIYMYTSDAIPENNIRYSVIDMAALSGDNFYIITEGGGFMNLNKSEDPRPRVIPSPHLRYEGIYADTLQRIWLVTAGGFDIYDTKTNNWHRINTNDGLPEKGVQGSIVSDKHGTLYVGSYGAFVKFKPYEFTFSEDNPQVKITAFKVFDQTMDHLLTENEVKLSFRDNFLSIGFSAFNYTQSENLTYMYKLSGVNKDWVTTQSETKADYTNLRGGKYTFQVQAINSNGLKSDIASLSIYLVPPFYEQWWFFILMALLLALIAFGLYKYRISQLKAVQAIRLQSEIDAQEKERSRLARDLHDDLGTRLSTLKLYLSSMENYLTPTEEAKNVKKYAEELLDSSVADLRNMLLNLSPETVTKYGFFHAVQDMAAKVNHSGIIKVNLNITGNTKRFNPAKELALYRICQELINNSLKHAECSTIDINTIIEEHQISLLYEDNGKGMNLNTGSRGYGFQNISNRLNLINGTISWDSSPGNGLRAIIEVSLLNKTKAK